MRAVDTNVLVRLVTRDDPRQVQSAEEFIARGAWISQLVLAETSWVLDSTYEFDAARLAVALGMLLNHEQLAVQDADVVAAALESFRACPGVCFSDCLIVEIARRQGHVPLGTFDRDLAKLDGAKRL